MLRVPAEAAIVRPAARVSGSVRVPGDKSISHRYALMAALADGSSTIRGYSSGADCAATLKCLDALGVAIRRTPDAGVAIDGRGVRGLAAPATTLDAANSGTTLRLLAGVLAAHPFSTCIGGDTSLERRPMRRVIEPLTLMGARVDSANGRPPLTVHGTSLRGIVHQPAVPSAQVKSAVLLAGLQAEGRTAVIEPAPTRDHTERALEAFGAHVERNGEQVTIQGGQRLRGRDLHVPGDLSGAVFWLVLAAGTSSGEVEITDVGLNPSRTAVLDVIRRAGARVSTTVEREEAGEPIGTVRVAHRELSGFSIEPGEVPALIDEIPALAALGAMMQPGSRMCVRGAAELRVKESDRITALAKGLRALGADVVEFSDGFDVHARPITGGTVDAADDHRLAMAFAIAATAGAAPTVITGAGAVDVSYPGFFGELARLTGSGDPR
ncbi:MAG: 3-phosphoshikimate 1-carboxyvinyltransferase [Acidobacteria bacterium]|nr:3-phosphoshikimate 1-carboxyvinyltransferase [Acidobacteriota bacterium]MCA1649077.1 3-phosphoshikimate 1-carboxyvinyltransferase [Acidobacteriota bacterium]